MFLCSVLFNPNHPNDAFMRNTITVVVTAFHGYNLWANWRFLRSSPYILQLVFGVKNNTVKCSVGSSKTGEEEADTDTVTNVDDASDPIVPQKCNAVESSVESPNPAEELDKYSVKIDETPSDAIVSEKRKATPLDKGKCLLANVFILVSNTSNR